MHSFNNTFRNLLSRGDSQRVIFRHGNHMSGPGNTSRYPDHKQMKRVHSGSEDEPTHSGEEDIAFIDVQTNSMAKVPEKGILKKHAYGAVDGKDKWGDDSQSEHLEAGSQSDGQEPGPGAVADMDYKFKDLNGYHEGIIVALKTAAAQRASAGSAAGSGDLRALEDYEYKRERAPSAEKIHEAELRRQRAGDEEEDDAPSCGPIRIRNLEDLIRQLEHHSSRHMSPSGSEDIRMSETEADRHYRIEPGEGPAGRHHAPLFGAAHGPHAHAHAHAPHSPHARAPPDDDALYETADAERLRDAPDSESDEFIQAQQQLARWASEDAVPAAAQREREREYFPSPPGSSSSDATLRHSLAPAGGPGRAGGAGGPGPPAPPASCSTAFPEYKH
ncbi:hypothetical protein MSG28_003700 [Choristoneura fumiferana]|uniref:Uncharacterized protein n=1 Tax=Choristoneura fumiferana TaxID=7141 RepID=A0ACC0KFU0_CHOFU|nr:hypothetical protein MSG28_003700 [Choristoneura fumiferana]